MGLALAPRALEVGLVPFFPLHRTPRPLLLLVLVLVLLGEREAFRLRGVWVGMGEYRASGSPSFASAASIASLVAAAAAASAAAFSIACCLLRQDRAKVQRHG